MPSSQTGYLPTSATIRSFLDLVGGLMESFEYRVLIRGWDDRGTWGWVKDGKWDRENTGSSEELLTDMGRQ